MNFRKNVEDISNA